MTSKATYSCDSCEQKYTVKRSLVRHVRVTHEGQTHACASCGRTFGRLDTMKTHSRTCNGPQHSCKDCDQEFALIDHLIEHRQEEHGERPHKRRREDSINLPDYIKRNKGLVSLDIEEHNNKKYIDKLSFFRCVALHKGNDHHALERHTKDIFQLCTGSDDTCNFDGVRLEDFADIEKKLELNIVVYEMYKLEDATVVVQLVQRSRGDYADTMYLNLYGDHYSYIKDRNMYTSSYQCPKCGKMWKKGYRLKRHTATCDPNVKYKYPGGVYQVKSTIFKKLEDEEIKVPEDLRYYPYRATYDFETYNDDKSSLPADSGKQQWKAEHVPLSVSVCSNIPGFESPECYITDGNPEELVKKMVFRLKEMSEEAAKLVKIQLKPYISILQQRIDQAKKTDPAYEPMNSAGSEYDDVKRKETKQHPLQKLQKELNEYIDELPVVGFNSGKYDVNVVKKYLMKELKIQYVIKKGNMMMTIKTPTLKFLDVINYLAPGYTYDQYLEAYGCTPSKCHLPYEWIDSLTKLDNCELPPHQAFFSELKKSNITKKEYSECQEVWQEKGMVSFRDYLIRNKNLDVLSFRDALGKQCTFYKEKIKIDMLKDGISVPGLTEQYLFCNLDTYFTLFHKDDADLHQTVKENIVGGPSIVFNRYHEENVTKLRNLEFGEFAKWCNAVVGYDANALYLWCLMQQMPTKWYTRRRAENKFKPERPNFSRMAMEWLEYLANEEGITIKHTANGKEKKIGLRQIRVDGWCPKNNTVYQFHGCYWHGCRCQTKERNDKCRKSMKELREETEEKSNYITACGYKLVEKWECEWSQMKKHNLKVKSFLENLKRPLDSRGEMTKDEVIEAVKYDRLFGLVEVDIEVPEKLKEKFKEMTPIFKNICIGRKDIGEYMKSYAEENNILSQPRRTLIGSYHAKKILLATPLLKWYMSHGLIVTKVYQSVEYIAEACFQQFGENVSKARRDGDVDDSKKILADTMKLLGNSAYGKTVTNKNKHVQVTYCDEKKAAAIVNEPHFKDMVQLSEDLYEVTSDKKRIVQDLPHHIGFFVYQYAKMKMLEFYYDFIDVYVDRKDYEYIQMDTDSAYIGLSADNLGLVVKPEKKEAFYREWDKWFVAEACNAHKDDFVKCMVEGRNWTRDNCNSCEEAHRYAKRTPGLFKEEWAGKGMIALCSKTYFGFGDKSKGSCKGLNKQQNKINKDDYLKVLTERKSAGGVNRGFRTVEGSTYTCEQQRDALSYFYGKREVLEDGVSTRPLKL